MKKLFLILLVGVLLVWNTFAFDAAWPKPDEILTNQHQAIITPPEENAFREGSYDAIHGDQGGKITGLMETQNKIETQSDATMRTINLIHRIINYALGFVSVIALVVLIFAGFQMVTAAGDDGKFQSGKKAIKKISIGIIGLAISWLIVSFIFRLLNTVML